MRLSTFVSVWCHRFLCYLVLWILIAVGMFIVGECHTRDPKAAEIIVPPHPAIQIAVAIVFGGILITTPIVSFFSVSIRRSVNEDGHDQYEIIENTTLEMRMIAVIILVSVIGCIISAMSR